MKISFQNYTLHQLLKSDDYRVFVVNTSDNVHSVAGKRIKGDIMIPIKTATAESVLLTIPATWIPIDLSLFADKTDIQKAHRFRYMLQTNQLALLSPEDAEKIMSTEDARREAKRINKNYHTQITAAQVSGQLTEAEIENNGLAVPEMKIEKLEINATVADLLGRDDVDGDEVYAVLNNMQDLKQEDWKYVMENSKHEDVQQLALRNIAN